MAHLGILSGGAFKSKYIYSGKIPDSLGCHFKIICKFDLFINQKNPPQILQNSGEDAAILLAKRSGIIFIDTDHSRSISKSVILIIIINN